MLKIVFSVFMLTQSSPFLNAFFLPCDTRLLRIAPESIFSAALQKFGGHGQVKVVRVTTPDREPIAKGVFGEPLFELKKTFQVKIPCKELRQMLTIKSVDAQGA